MVFIGLLALSQTSAEEVPVLLAVAFDHAVATSYFELYETLVRETPGFSAPVVARAYAYAGVVLYQALVFAMPERRSLSEVLAGLEAPPMVAAALYPPAVGNAALEWVTRALFSNVRPKNVLRIDDLAAGWRAHHAAAVSADVLEDSHAYGVLVAEWLWLWAERDGGAQGQLSNFDSEYRLPVGSTWQPTPREVGAPLPPLQPNWGNNRPFAPSLAACAPPPPPGYSEEAASQLYREALEVVAAVRAITPAERETAQYWADDPSSSATPAGHWVAIATGLLQAGEADLAFAAEAYARLGMALNDAFISCWATKFRELYVRPITYVQRVIDAEWNEPRLTDPLLTPPFPEYTSGHSVVSAAAATVLSALFGEQTVFVDDFHIGRGFGSRTYSSFWEAAEEAAYSRLVGGIHFRSGIEHGVSEGRCVAEQLLAIDLRRVIRD